MSGVLIGFGAALALFALAAGGRVSFWDEWGAVLWSSPAAGVLAGAVCILAGFLRARMRREPLRVEPLGLAAGLLLVVVSDWITRPYSLFPGPAIRGEIALLTLVLFALLRREARFPAPAIAAAAVLFVLAWFLLVADGRMIFSDDHPSFVFRLRLLVDNFPLVPLYTPLWNGGMEWRDVIGVGALNVLAVLLPFLPFGTVESLYTFGVGLVLFVLLPAGAYLGARVLTLDRQAAALAALASFAPALFWFRWGLKYGAMGFVTAAALIPLNLALMTKWFDRDEPLSRKFVAAAVVSITLSILWPLAPLMLIVPVVFALPVLPALLRKRRFVLTGVLVVALNLPWMIVFASASKVLHFISVDKAAESAEVAADAEPASHWTASTVKKTGRELSFQSAEEVFAEAAATYNPFLVLFGLPGVFLLRRSWHRRVFLGTIAWLALVGTAGALVKPQFELDRFLLILTLVCCIPAGAAAAELLAPPREFVRRTAASFVAACLVAGVFVAGHVVYNRSAERYVFAGKRVHDTIAFVRAHGGTGRAAFTGFILHELGGGHFAPLPYFTGVPVLGNAPVHSKWQYEDLVPIEVKAGGAPAIERWFDLHHVTLVAAHEPWWKRYLQAHPELYRPAGTIGRFDYYHRPQYTGGYFLEGEGKVLAQRTGALELSLRQPDAIVKFNYVPVIEADRCAIEGVPVDSLTLIRLTGCPINEPITIRALPPWRRIF